MILAGRAAGNGCRRSVVVGASPPFTGDADHHQRLASDELRGRYNAVSADGLGRERHRRTGRAGR
jgi:hypothetical protein